MSEFERIDLTSESIPGVCAACLKHGIRHISGLRAVRCEHTETVAWNDVGLWRTARGVSKEDFTETVAKAILLAEGYENIFKPTVKLS